MLSILIISRVQIRSFFSQGHSSNHINQCLWSKKKKNCGKQQLAHFIVPWQHSSGPEFCHVPPESEWAWPGLQKEGRVWGYGDKGDTGADYGKSQYEGPSQWSCTDDEPTDSGPCVDWDGFRVEVDVDVDVDVEGRQEGHWQAAHPRWKEMSAASCHVVFVARWKIRTASLGLLAGPHYPISSEVTHWGRLSLLLLSPVSLSLCERASAAPASSFFLCMVRLRMLLTSFYYIQSATCTEVDKITINKW